MSNMIVTEIDEFFALVRDRGELTMGDICEIMDKEIELVERWAQALSEVGMLSVHYPIVQTSKHKTKVRFKENHAGTQKRAYPVQGFLVSNV